MALFGWGKNGYGADIVGHNLTSLAMDADDCWRDVCQLRTYKTTGPVATCEMAFARGGIALSVMRQQPKSSIVERLEKACIGCVVEAFADQDIEETLDFYNGKLSERGPEIVALYAANTFMLEQWASTLGSRLGVPGMWSAEITPIAERQQIRLSGLVSKIKIV